MDEEFKIVILAVFDEHNFANKALTTIHGKPMIQHAYDRALESGASQIVVATDNPRVGMQAEDFGATVCMLMDESITGVARLAEIADKMEWGDETIIVNFPADAPLTPASILQQVAHNLTKQKDADCATLYTVVNREIADRQDTINMVLDNEDLVIYCSRTAIPHQSTGTEVSEYKIHNGINAYRAGLLRIYRLLPSGLLDQAENIEELKLLYNGMKIHAEEANSLIGKRVLTEADIEKVEAQIAPG